MAGEYQRAFGRFPENASFAPWQKWQGELLQQRFDADDYVFLGQVRTSTASGHGGIRFGHDGWAWLIGLGKVFGRKTGTIPWSRLDYLEIRKDPFSISYGNASESVQFVALADGQSFGMGQMADVLVPGLSQYAKGGAWLEADEFPSRGADPFSGTVEALWRRTGS